MVYTFKSFPYTKELNLLYQDVQVLKSLKKDLDAFTKEIRRIKPAQILGLAKSTRKFSTIEKYTINQFHGKKKITNATEQKLELTVPNRLNNCFKINKNPTDSFCNYSMFKIQWFLKENKLEIPFSFIHIVEKDLKKLPLLDYYH